ncbi:hypothetical protein MMC13_001568 [Lambiella insularis]|nr:hypothetical protein [Lambiella insularis]
MTKPQILFIDAYDSFTNNIVALLETQLVCEVSQITIDAPVPDLASYLKQFTAVIAGPGPGHPAEETDVGLIKRLWFLSDDDIIPVLGICLGFQSLVLSFGGTVAPLNQPKHGIRAQISTSGSEIFQDLQNVDAVQYHSLHASLGHDVPAEAANVEDTDYLWEPHQNSPSLLPLAWNIAQSHSHDDARAQVSKNPTYILMAVKHVSKPFYGIQFHPESVCSGPSAAAILVKWWVIVRDWHEKRGDTDTADFFMRDSDLGTPCTPSSPSSDEGTDVFGTPIAYTTPQSSSRSSSLNRPSSSTSLLPSERPFLRACHEGIPIGGLSLPDICALVNSGHKEKIVLDSECCQMRNLGTHSIIGIVLPNSLKLKYKIGATHVEWRSGDQNSVHQLGKQTIFQYLADFMEARRTPHSHTEIPFYGGLMGYINYEACLETIATKSEEIASDRPDVCFAYVERSIVVHHLKNRVYVQSIKQDDDEWIAKTCATLREASIENIAKSRTAVEVPLAMNRYEINLPSRETYGEKIRRCQQEIRAGNSYELCLTNQATVKISPTQEQCPWPLYLRLRHLNPAPFAAYVRLGPLTLLSTSPERFMTWSRPRPVADEGGMKVQSICQFRPIKGTVRKHQLDLDGISRTVGLAEARAVLSTTKEQAENLMIVDLIRHDLHGVVGSCNVKVKDLMIVEEYESVYQLVSVIEGTLEGNAYRGGKEHPAYQREVAHVDDSRTVHRQGIEVLAASLPPGSMTGAPKRRSCRLLQSIEEHEPRSIYSGVLGYMCVGGGGDFSVVIRSVYKWDRDEEEAADEWRIGAGGAVTALSTEEGEWEEMLTKLRSTLRLFTEAGR